MKRVNKRGFELIEHREMLFDDHCKAFPTEIIQSLEGIAVYKTVLPYSHRESTVVYFVTSKNGDEYGQFGTSGEAILAAMKAREERKKV